MKLVFLSNFYNHHQDPVCSALAAQENVNFRFIACERITEERREMWGEIENLPDFVLTPRTVEDWATAAREILDADAVVVGSAPQKLLAERLRAGKLILRYQERPLKNGLEPLKFLPRMIRWHSWNSPGKNVYLLCASAYTAGDYEKMGLFRGKAYKWGYFPETRFYDCEALLSQKEPGSIFWAGRLLDLKHPDEAVRVAGRLRDHGFAFTLRIAGSGAMEPQLRALIVQLHLEHRVQLLGNLTPDQVRHEMERSRIYLFTSDRREGWGAVLNEAMNSSCAVIANHAAGSTPYLVEDGVNGLVYQDRHTDGLYEKLTWLVRHPMEQTRIGKAAYKTITETWNAHTAAERLCGLVQAILSGDSAPELCEEGPCSRA